MKTASRKKFTTKIIISYAILLLLGVVASFFIYTEVEKYISAEILEENDEKLLMASSLLTKIYEAENLSKLMLQNNTVKNVNRYAQKVDSIIMQIDSIKLITENEEQLQLLDSVSLLLQNKVANGNELGKLRKRQSRESPLDSLLQEFARIEEDLGRIPAESLVQDFATLSPKMQALVRDYASILNENVPEDPSASESFGQQKVDSILNTSKAMLLKAVRENRHIEHRLAQRETALIRTDLEISQKLQRMISEIDREIAHNITVNDALKQKVLTRSIRLAGIAALIGLLVVGIFTFIITRDFFRVQHLKNQLEDEKVFSESVLKSREQLIATVSHDLRTPLNTISGYSNLLEESMKDEKQKEYIARVSSATDYVENLVNDLLDFSKIEAGKIILQSKAFDIATLIHETAHENQKHYAKSGVDLSVNIADDFQRTIVSDPVRIKQILGNLIGNAFKFTPQGSVTVEARMKKENMVVTVQDTGVGIDKNLQKEIFKEFSQGEPHTEAKFGGYGLGLTISKKLALLLEGDISLYSELGKGSCFTFTMPVQFSKKSVPADEAAIIDFRAKTVLVIDDDLSLSRLIAEILVKSGHHAITFNDFKEVSKTEELDYDIVLSDIQMPSVDGFEVLKSLHSGDYRHYRNQPIIAMTGDRSKPLSQYLKYGFSDVIQKPFSKTKLLQKLHLGVQEDSSIQSFSVSKAKPKSLGQFNLATIRTFLGEDEQALTDLVATFLNELKVNMKTLTKAIKKNDTTIINETAHRMLPMLRQLEATKAIAPLEVLEHIKNTSPEEAQKTFERVKKAITNLESTLKLWLYQTSRS